MKYRTLLTAAELTSWVAQEGEVHLHLHLVNGKPHSWRVTSVCTDICDTERCWRIRTKAAA